MGVGGASTTAEAADEAAGGARVSLVAVLPVENLTGRAAPLEEVRGRIERALLERGAALLSPEQVDELLRAVRVRYTGGVGDATAEAFRSKGGVDAVLVTDLGTYEVSDPPRVTLEARLVSLTGEVPSPVWATEAALAGDDAPGAFDLGLVGDPEELLDRAVRHVADGLIAFLASGPRGGEVTPPRADSRFAPRRLYVAKDAPAFGTDARRVAVMPFLNDSLRRGAGDAVAIQFVRELVEMGGVEVIEPGRVRDVLLDTRIVQEGGISQSQADLLRGILDADLVIAGRVSEFQEAMGTSSPRVELSVYGLDTRKRQAVWLARTYAEGTKHVFFFGLGEVRSASRLTRELVRGVLRAVVGRSGQS
jgi:hypothetical protein